MVANFFYKAGMGASTFITSNANQKECSFHPQTLISKVDFHSIRLLN